MESLFRKSLLSPSALNHCIVYFPTKEASLCWLPVFQIEYAFEDLEAPFLRSPYRLLAIFIQAASPLGAVFHLVKARQSLMAFWNGC